MSRPTSSVVLGLMAYALSFFHVSLDDTRTLGISNHVFASVIVSFVCREMGEVALKSLTDIIIFFLG